MRIGITGSNGFIGSALTNYFLSVGHEVFLLQRKKPDVLRPKTVYCHFDLNEQNDVEEYVSGLHVLIHTAFIPELNGNHSSQKNIERTLALSNACLKHQVYFVFLSSLSAHEEALSAYGKHKFELENKLEKSASLILKLGLVTGTEGLYSRIKSIAAQSKFILLVGGGNQPEQTVAVEDVVKVIASCIHQKLTGIYFLASPEVVTLKEIFADLASQAGTKPVFIPVPFFIAEIGIGLLQLLQISSPVSKENLLGLKRMRAFDTKADWEKFGLHG